MTPMSRVTLVIFSSSSFIASLIANSPIKVRPRSLDPLEIETARPEGRTFRCRAGRVPALNGRAVSLAAHLVMRLDISF
jgi:hypothetical protein